MKGLLVKDFRFLLNQKASMIIFLGLGLFFMLSGKDVSLALGYTTMMIAIFTTSSISYDGFDNGMAFLLTLPVQRKTYAVSKYVFSLIVIMVMGLLISGIAIVANAFGYSIGMSNLAEGLVMSVSWSMVIAAFTIPIYLKFGSEKSRYAMAIFVGLAFAGAYVMQGIIGDVAVRLLDVLIALGYLPVAAMVVIISMLISIRIMEKKEY